MSGPRKVTIITGNVVAWDGRAQKIAISLAKAGWDVTVIGRPAKNGWEEGALGRVRVVELAPRRRSGTWRQRHVVDLEGVESALVELEPDVIHAHAVETLPLAVAGKRRGEADGRAVGLVYDAHEHVAGVDRPDPTWRLAMLVEEREGIERADGVVTVSEPLADLLQRRYGLRERPAVVANAPERDPFAAEGGARRSDVRADCGLDAGVPLLVYSGAVAPARGLATVLDALAELPGVHLALQVAARHRYVTDLEEQARALGVNDRLHVLPYVAARRVVEYIGTATAGVIPLLHGGNHEVALTNKYLECMHARLPVIVSDVSLQAGLTGELGNGAVFRAGDVAALVAAVGRVLEDSELHTAAYRAPGLLATYSWEAQVPALVSLYGRITS